MTAPPRTALAVHRLMLRTARTPLGRLWVLLYRLVARVWVAYLAWGERGAAAYERAASGTADVVPGISDVDVALVLRADPAGDGLAAARVRERWQRLRTRLPSADLLLDYPRVYEEAELRRAVSATTLTYGLGEGGDDEALGYYATHDPDLCRMLERPGLYGATADWRLLRGPERRPEEPSRDAQQRRIAAWLELANCWRSAFLLCTTPVGPRSATLSVRNVTEPARVWLWLAHGERPASRTETLERAAHHLPGEPALRDALELQASLTFDPDPPEDRMLPALARFSSRIAAEIARQLGAVEATRVRLAGAQAPVEGAPLPLCDWVGIVWPRLAGESFRLSDADPGSPSAIAEAVAAEDAGGPLSALRADGVLVLPAPAGPRARLRAVQCRATDPVSFALAQGDGLASFPDLAGWSAGDVARRAVAEHRRWMLLGPEARTAPEGQAGMLGRLFTAARAVLFLESIKDGDPELAVTVTATARGIALRWTGAAAEQAQGEYVAWAAGGERPTSGTVDAMAALVAALPPFAEAGRVPA